MNELDDAHVFECILFDARTVLFRLNVTDVPALYDPDVIERCMTEYTRKYHPNVERWTADCRRVGHWMILDIVVVGKINLDNAAKYVQD